MTAPEERPGRLAVGVVGSGRVGSVLGAALARAGHQVVAVSGVSAASRPAGSSGEAGAVAKSRSRVARQCRQPCSGSAAARTSA